MIDPYVYPGTDVLRNKPGLRDHMALSEVEYKAAASRETELEKNPIKGNFDMAHLRAYHRHLFQDVYDWAGELRTVDMSKGGDDFAPILYLEPLMQAIHKRLENNKFLRGLGEKDFVEIFTDVYSDLNAVHPFRDGNGRATRCFMKSLADQAGYAFDYSRLGNRKSRWDEASRLSNSGQTGELLSIIGESIRPLYGNSFN
jgi:cell filamentation protein